MASIVSPKGIEVKITLLDRETGGQYTIPVLPTNGELAYDDGDQQPISLNILDVGTVMIPNGVDLDSVSWESFFPARHDPYYCSVPKDKLKSPEQYRDTISGWKDDGAQIQFICPAFGINKTMFIESFKPSLKGFEGDIYYSIKLTEYKPIRPRKITVPTSSGATLAKGPATKDRPEAVVSTAAAAKPKTYTVKSGDSLTLIAKRFGVSSTTLYANNKATIGPNPNKITPGMVLKL